MSEHTHHLPAVEDRVRALESLLVEKGLITTDGIDQMLAWAEHDIGPLNGARVAARAWVDPEFKARLLTDATSAIAELGIDHGAAQLIVVESTPAVHQVVCCTLCSCYPWRLLGLPPTWYKSPEYRSRVVIEPRQVLHEFNCDVPPETEVRVWDSTSECRYMVLPERPPDTDHLGEEELMALISRNSLVGVERVAGPARG